MRIRSFEFSDPAPSGFKLDLIRFRDGVNLFVGASGAGKTRLMNMLFNIGSFVAGDSRYCPGTWTIEFEHDAKNFVWSYKGISDTEKGPWVTGEDLWLGTREERKEHLLSRTDTQITFKGAPAPKLARSSSALYLLREEDDIGPVHKGFSLIMRRNFSGDELSNAAAFQQVPRRLVRLLEKKRDIAAFHGPALSLHTKLYLLHRFFPAKFELISANFKKVFPSVERIEVRMREETLALTGLDLPLAGDIPIVFCKEPDVEIPTPLNEMSSGMQKVLLIICDVMTMPKDMLYMIDEYENSLGINAIDFLPGFLNEFGEGRQFFVTSHHPSLINSIPVASWFVMNRKGTHIRTKYGRELEERYGTSRQQKFIQLINDPFFAESGE